MTGLQLNFPISNRINFFKTTNSSKNVHPYFEKLYKRFYVPNQEEQLFMVRSESFSNVETFSNARNREFEVCKSSLSCPSRRFGMRWRNRLLKKSWGIFRRPIVCITACQDTCRRFSEILLPDKVSF